MPPPLSSSVVSLPESSSRGPGGLADGLDGALEAGGGLQLQLVGHGVDLEAVQPGGRRQTSEANPRDDCVAETTKAAFGSKRERRVCFQGAAIAPPRKIRGHFRQTSRPRRHNRVEQDVGILRPD